MKCVYRILSVMTHNNYILIATSFDEMHILVKALRLVKINLYFIPVMHVFIRINILGRVF